MVTFIPAAERRTALLARQADHLPVLICGGSGSGKSALARWIHTNGPRSAMPCIPFSATSSGGLTSHAMRANHGTLIVSEIEALKPSDLKTLVDLVTTRSFSHPDQPEMRILMNVRLIATTDQDLQIKTLGETETHYLWQRLWDRLKFHKIVLPELSSRKDEIEEIVLGLLQELAHESHKEYVRRISYEAWEKIKSYEWPGGIRELRNVLHLAVLATKGDTVLRLPAFEGDRKFLLGRSAFEREIKQIAPTLTETDDQIDRY
jgi:DNA-binding NtrC family response regulator